MSWGQRWHKNSTKSIAPLWNSEPTVNVDVNVNVSAVQILDPPVSIEQTSRIAWKAVGESEKGKDMSNLALLPTVEAWHGLLHPLSLSSSKVRAWDLLCGLVVRIGTMMSNGQLEAHVPSGSSGFRTFSHSSCLLLRRSSSSASVTNLFLITRLPSSPPSIMEQSVYGKQTKYFKWELQLKFHREARRFSSLTQQWITSKFPSTLNWRNPQIVNV